MEQILSEGQIYKHEPMSRHTTFHIGGPADYFVRPERKELPLLISFLEQEKMPFLVIGNGSNLLVGDKGIRGVVIEVGRKLQDIRFNGCEICAEAGALLSRTAALAAKQGLTGLEFASGIPGTIGGAVVMNAGAYGSEMKQVVQSVKVITRNGEIKELSPEELDFSYRHSCIPEKGYLIISARLLLRYGVQEEIEHEIELLKQQRVQKQPLEYPSAGSTFKRPQGYFAGKLIMDCGLRGYQVGGAQISEKHCGFVINKNKATASDICCLIKNVKARVYEAYGINLETEVKFVGEF